MSFTIAIYISLPFEPKNINVYIGAKTYSGERYRGGSQTNETSVASISRDRVDKVCDQCGYCQLDFLTFTSNYVLANDSM